MPPYVIVLIIVGAILGMFVVSHFIVSYLIFRKYFGRRSEKVINDYFLYSHNYINILVYDFNTFFALIPCGSILGNITYILSWGINLGELTCSEDSSWAFNELRWHCCILEFLPYLFVNKNSMQMKDFVSSTLLHEN